MVQNFVQDYVGSRQDATAYSIEMKDNTGNMFEGYSTILDPSVNKVISPFAIVLYDGDVITMKINGEVVATYVVGTVDIEKIEDKIDMVIYPNPTTDYISIKNNFTGLDKLEILDITGKNVLTKNNCEGNNIDISNLKSGVYNIIITSDNKTYVNKFVKK